MAKIILPDRTYLCEAVRYDPETGEMWWRERPVHHFRNRAVWSRWNGRYTGKPAGVADERGYVSFKLGKRVAYVHRVAFKIMTGRDADPEVDHENRIKSDNRWNNLREATGSQNKANKALSTRSTTGLKGVNVERKTGKFKAYISWNNKTCHLGTFDTAVAAHAAYCEAAELVFGEFCNPG